MSRKKQPTAPTLVGLDGRPLKRIAPKPEPQAQPTAEPVTATRYFGSPITEWVTSFTIKLGDEPLARPKAGKRSFRDVVSEQLTAIHNVAPAEWRGDRELPPPTAAELERYDVAIEWATRHCEHKRETVSTTYARHEYQCMDCGRYFTRKPSPFGFFS